MVASVPNPNKTKPLSWLPRFSLKWLLLFVTAVCIWLGTVVHKANRQRDAVRTIKDLGGAVSYSYVHQWKPGFPVSRPYEEPDGPAWLRQLIGNDYFGDVIHVDLQHSFATDETMIEIAKLSNLEELNLFETEVTDVGVKRIGRLSNLRWLWLAETRITDESLIEIGKLKNLKVLCINGSTITDAGVTHLQGLSKLQHFRLIGTLISDAAMPTVRNLVSLTELELTSSNVSDQGLMKLVAMPKLTYIGLSGTRTTKEGRALFQTARPGVQIEYQW